LIFMITPEDLRHSIPLLIIAFASITTLLLDVYFKNKDVVFGFSIVSVIAAIISSVFIMDMNMIIYNDFIKVSNITTSFIVIILVSILITILASRSYLIKEDINFGEFYSLLLFSVLGMMLMVQANDIIMIFLGVELMSVCFYVLAGFLRKRVKPIESGMKYFLLRAFMTVFLLYGMALMYGVTGTTKLSLILSQALTLN